MRVYEAVFDESQKGVYALSVVENPAMEDFWITLSEQEQEIQLAEVNEEKRLLLGAALIPNKKIYRNVDGNEFYITFSEDTIEKLSHKFFTDQNNNNSSEEHNIALEGMSVVESWMVEDPLKDKSNLYGKTYEKGTWVTMMKVDNDGVWQKAKEGKLKGFSIDALLGLQEIKLNTNKMSETVELKKSITEAIKDGFNALFNKEQEVKEEVKPEEIEVASEEVVAEVEEVNVDETVKEAIAEFSKQVDSKIEEMKAEFSTQLSAKEEEITGLKTELAKQPEVEEIKPNPEVKETVRGEGGLVEFLNNNL